MEDKESRVRGGVPAPLLLDAADRAAVITGAAGGIGTAAVALFAAAGARIAAIDRKKSATGERVIALVADATDERALGDALDEAVSRLGPIDYVVHAVGTVGAGPLHELALEDWRNQVDANLTAAFLVARGCYRHLRRPGGSVIFIGSTNGRNGGSALSGPAYAAAKAGIQNLARYLAKEWAPEGLRVNCIAAGPVQTSMLDRLSAEQHRALAAAIPLGRYTRAEEIAAAAAFLCSIHAASITGACLNVSGGLVLD